MEYLEEGLPWKDIGDVRFGGSGAACMQIIW